MQGHLLLGVMAHTMKARDLLRDPRCLLHSTITGPNNAEGEFKLHGRARPVVDRQLRDADHRAWWTGRPDSRKYP